MGFTPQYGMSSLGVLVGTVGPGVMTAGSAALGPVGFVPLPNRPTANLFTSADVGRIVTVMGAGPSGALLIARVLTYVNGNNVILDRVASTSTVPGIDNTTIFRPVKIKANSMEYSDSITDSPQGSFVSEQLSGEYAPCEGQPFLFTSTDPSVGDSWGTFSGGEIDSVDTDYLPGTVPKATISTCKCVSYKAVLQRRVMRAQQFSSTDQQTIAAYLVAQATADFIGLVTVTGPSVPLFSVDDYTFIADALDSLIRTISDSAHSYFWQTDQWRNVHIANETSIPAPWSVSDTGLTDGNVRVKVSIASSRDKLVNQKYLKAAKTLGTAQTDTIINSFLGTPLPIPRRAFTLKQKAGGVPPTISITGLSAQKVWVAPTDPRNDSTVITIPAGYDWAWPIDSDYLFCDGSRPGLPSGQTATIQYYVPFEALESYLAATSVSERSSVQGGSGIHESVESTDKPVTVAELSAVTQSSTEAASVIPRSVLLESFRGGLAAGQGLTVSLTEINAVANYLIESVQLAEEDGWVRWDIKASIGTLIGDWVKGLSDAFRPDLANGVGVKNVSGSALAVAFSGGNGQETVPYSSTLVAVGGVPAYTYGISSGSLPTGLSLDPATGIISGTPTAQGTYSFVAIALDTAGNTATIACSVVVAELNSADVPGALATSVAASEVGNSVYQDSNGGLHMVITVSPVVAASRFPVRLRYWFDFSDGRGPVLQGDRYSQSTNPVELFGQISQDTGVLQPGGILVPTDPARVNWIVYVEANSFKDQPTGAAASFAFTVTAAQPAPANDITNIHFVPDPDTGDIISYALSDQIWFYIWHEIDFTQPCTDPGAGAAVSDAYFKSSFCTKQLGYGYKATCTVTGGVNVQVTGTVLDSDVGNEVHIGGLPLTITAYTDPTHFVIGAAVANGVGLALEIWRPAPSSFAGTEGADDPGAIEQGYRGRKFTDGSPASNAGQTLVQIKGIPSWNIPPATLPDGTPNLYLEMRIWVWAVSRLADNERGGVETITRQTTWPANADGSTDYGSIFPVQQSASLDLRRVSKINSFGGSSVITGGDGDPLDVGVSGALDKIAKEIVIRNLGVTSGYIADQAATDRIMAQNSVTYANDAVAANALVDSKIASSSIGKLIAGTVVFSGDVSLARGNGQAVVTLNNTGIFLYSACAASGSGVTPGVAGNATYSAAGLTALPYVAVQASQIGVFSGGAGPSVTIAGGGINLWTANGNIGSPYAILTASNGFLLVNGSFTLALTAAQIQMKYTAVGQPSATATLDSTGFGVALGSASFKVGPSQLQFLLGASSSLTMGVPNGLTLATGNSQVAITNSAVTLTYPNISVQMGLASGSSRILMSYLGTPGGQMFVGDGFVSMMVGDNGLGVSDSSISLEFGPSIVYVDTYRAHLAFGPVGASSMVKADAFGVSVSAYAPGVGIYTSNFYGDVFTTFKITCTGIQIQDNPVVISSALTATTATAGAGTLPAKPAGFFMMQSFNGVTYTNVRVPYYLA